MSTHPRVLHRCTEHGPVPTTESVDGPGAYLTDEVFLYRITNVVMCGLGEIVELEDCYALDVVEVPISDVRARRLRVVTPAIAA